jgi:hypothetical protein
VFVLWVSVTRSCVDVENVLSGSKGIVHEALTDDANACLRGTDCETVLSDVNSGDSLIHILGSLFLSVSPLSKNPTSSTLCCCRFRGRT